MSAPVLRKPPKSRAAHAEPAPKDRRRSPLVAGSLLILLTIFVYLPTTPNPTSGYTVVLPRSETLPVQMTVDEGLKLIVSGGFVAPPLRPNEPRGAARTAGA